MTYSSTSNRDLEYEAKFIRDAALWPVEGALFMKKLGKIEFGIMIPGNETTIFEDDKVTIKKQYGSLRELQEDEWVVD